MTKSQATHLSDLAFYVSGYELGSLGYWLSGDSYVAVFHC